MMINVATVHWQDMRWVDVQLRYLDRFLDAPHRVWSFVGDEGADEAHKFHYASTLPIRQHEYKLDLLADLIIQASDDDDVLIFIDGDAFPVAPLVPYIEKHLSEFPLLAIRRDENAGDPQPHPSFCATTAGFWREITGTWRRGATWPGPNGGPVTDVGANLRKILMDRGIEWHPMLRSNARNPDRLLFGVYDGMIYHHGAGFRGGFAGGRAAREQRLAKEAELQKEWPARMIDAVPKKGLTEGLAKSLRRRHPVVRYHDRLRSEYADLCTRVWEEILRNEDFFITFTDLEREPGIDLTLPPHLAELA